MPRSQSRLASEIDFDRDGKQHGFIRLPYSVHRSAYGWIPIPVASLKNGDGPRVLLMAGNHGDEYEGQVALGKLIRSLEPADMRGRIIILPSANFPAAMAGMRTSPLDEGNLNRSFPGDPYGGPTEQIADYIESVLLPQCDFVFDFHSGGSSLTYVPSALLRRGQGAVHDDKIDLFGLHLSRDRFDLALADKGRGTDRAERDAFGSHHGEINRARQADRLFAPRLRTAQRLIRLSRQTRTDDQSARGQTRLLPFDCRCVTGALRRPPRTW